LDGYEPIQSAPGSPDPDSVTLAKGGSITLVGRLVGRGLQVLAQAALARLLGPEAFGLYAIGWALLYLGGLTEPLGLDRGIIKFGTQYWQKDDPRFKGVFLESLTLGLISGGLIGLGYFLGAPFIATTIFHKPDLAPVIVWLAIAFPLKTGLTVCAAATRISQRMVFSTYSQDIAQPLSNVILIFVFNSLGWKLFGAVLATTLSFGIGFVLSLYFVFHLFPRIFNLTFKPLWGGSRRLIEFSLPASFGDTLSNLTNRMDRLLMGVFRASAEVGIYQSASQFSLISATILGSISAALSPMIVDLFLNNQKQRLDDAFKISTKWALYLSMPVCLVVISQPVNTLAVLFGNSYTGGASALVILAAIQLFNAGTGAVGTIMVMTGQQKAWFVISGISLIVDVLVGITLIPVWGMVGAAIGSAASIVVLYLIGLLRIRATLGIWPYDKRFIKGITAGLVTAAVLLIWARLAPVSPLGSLIVASLFAVVVPLSTLLLMGLDPEDKVFLHAFLDKVRPKHVH
jgi:O-antigen/teichoic acid export membrane protein